MKLISMTDFVLRNLMLEPHSFKVVVKNYATFLKKPLKLEMFVPCDENGNILEYPTNISISDSFKFEKALSEYLEAKEKVLFEGFIFKQKIEGVWVFSYKQKTNFCILENNFKMEWLIDDEVELTENAIKQLGL